MAGVRVLLYFCSFVACTSGFLEQTEQPVLWDCEFERDYDCGFVNSYRSSTSKLVPWKRQKGSNDQTSVGPQGDHSTGRAIGHFLSVKFDSKYSQQSTKLTSSTIFESIVEGQCLTFWHYIYDEAYEDKDIATLWIVVDESNYGLWSSSWSHRATQTKGWIKAQAPIHYSNPFTLRLRAERDVNFKDAECFVAVDDFVLTNGSCAGVSAIESCDFEDGVCTWKTTEWERKTGRTGPVPGDHTTNGGGYYLYAEKKDFKTKVEVDSEKIYPQGPKQCIKFYYMVDGGELRLIKDKFGVDEILWESTGHTGGQWNYAEATIMSTRKYTVTFQLVNGHPSQAALDDTEIVEGACHEYSYE